MLAVELRKSAMLVRIHVDETRITAFCKRNGIRRFAFFGSVLRPDFGPESDVDVLVDFDPESVPGLLGIARMERELSGYLAGRKVDIRTREDLSRYFRQRVVDESEVLYVRR